MGLWVVASGGLPKALDEFEKASDEADEALFAEDTALDRSLTFTDTGSWNPHLEEGMESEFLDNGSSLVDLN